LDQKEGTVTTPLLLFNSAAWTLISNYAKPLWRRLVVGLRRLRYFLRFLSFFAFFTGSTRLAGAIISIGGGGSPC
jgi:hypothetical protein